MGSRWRGLQIQIILWTILPLTLFLIGFSFTGIYSHQQSMRNLVEERDRSLALVYAGLITEELNRRTLVLQETVAQESFRHLETPTRAELLIKDSAAYEVFHGRVAWLRLQGDTAASWVANWEQKLLRELIEDVVSSGQPAFSPVTDVGGEKSFLIGVPVANGSQTSALLIGSLTVSELGLDKLLAQVDIGNNKRAYLMDSEGHFLCPDSFHQGTKNEFLPQLIPTLTGRTGSLFQRDSEDREVVIAYATVPQTGWKVIIQEPWEEVIAPILHYPQLMPFILIAATLVSLLAVIFGIHYITRPLQVLGRQARRLAWGDFSATDEPVGGVKEIEDLRLTLDQMAHQIQEYQRGMRDYLAFITRGQEEERRRLARELHDDAIQNLIVLTQEIERVQKALTKDVAAASSHLAGLKEKITDIIQDIRRFTHGLRPTYLEDLGLIPALEMLLEKLAQEGLQTSFESNGARRLSSDVELAAFRIAQEALNNAARHAQASHVRLGLDFADDGLTISIEDNGVGFMAPERPWELARDGHFGLMGMRERALMFGGHLSIESHPGKGTKVIAFLPYQLP